MNRGNAKGDIPAHGAAAAIADYDAAIDLGEALRRDLGPVWTNSPQLRDELAKAHNNRGLAKRGSAAHGAEAIDDLDAAIDLQEALRRDLGPDWTNIPQLRNHLASAYNNRGAAKQGSAAHGAIAAIADYDKAIELREALRRDLGPDWTNSLQLRNDLATAYMNRGNAKGDIPAHGAAAAIDDFDTAIGLREALRRDLGPAWTNSPELRSELASAYMNRGRTHSKLADAGDARARSAALSDFGIAKTLYDDLLRDVSERSPAIKKRRMIATAMMWKLDRSSAPWWIRPVLWLGAEVVRLIREKPHVR
jgi:tetratricopeptide (TPR) repeat protein